MTKKTQAHGWLAKTSARRPAKKDSPRPSPAPVALDATQQALLAKLESSREPWQTIGRYDAERPQEHPERRRAAGAQVLKSVPHAAHAAWAPPKNRPNPVDTVVAGNAGRQEDLVPLRMGRMAVSPFAFLRGAAAVMAWDLSHTPVSGMQVLIDGDAHINNFGLYGTPQRDVIADLNDFDEATMGPWEWDLKRLVASVNVAGRENGLSPKERQRAVRKTVGGYRFNIARLSAMGVLEVWSLFGYAERRPTFLKVPNQAWAIIQKTVGKAKRTTNETLLPKIAHRRHDGGWRFQDDPPVLTRVDADTRRKVVASLADTPSISRQPTGPCCAGTGRRCGPPRGRRRERRHPRLSGAALRQRGHGPALPPSEGGDRARARRLPAAAGHA